MSKILYLNYSTSKICKKHVQILKVDVVIHFTLIKKETTPSLMTLVRLALFNTTVQGDLGGPLTFSSRTRTEYKGFPLYSMRVRG